MNDIRSGSQEADASWTVDGDSPSSRPKSSSRFAAVTERNAPREGADEDEDGDPMSGKKLAPKWLKGFTAEDILKDKNLLRQQLEVRGLMSLGDSFLRSVVRRLMQRGAWQASFALPLSERKCLKASWVGRLGKRA